MLTKLFSTIPQKQYHPRRIAHFSPAMRAKSLSSAPSLPVVARSSSSVGSRVKACWKPNSGSLHARERSRLGPTKREIGSSTGIAFRVRGKRPSGHRCCQGPGQGCRGHYVGPFRLTRSPEEGFHSCGSFSNVGKPDQVQQPLLALLRGFILQTVAISLIAQGHQEVYEAKMTNGSHRIEGKQNHRKRGTTPSLREKPSHQFILSEKRGRYTGYPKLPCG